MAFKWVNNDIATPSVTIYESNFTLNRIASTHFNDCAYVVLGDDENGMLGIHPVTRKEIDMNVFDKTTLHKISIGKSYGRISNKQFISLLGDKYGYDFTVKGGIKFDATFDEEEEVLLIKLLKE